MKATQYAKSRSDAFDGDPKTRGYYKQAELENTPLTVTGVLEVGESRFENENGQHDPFITCAVLIPRGSEVEEAKLRLTGRGIVPMVMDFFEEHPDDVLEGTLVKDYAWEGARAKSWHFRD